MKVKLGKSVGKSVYDSVYNSINCSTYRSVYGSGWYSVHGLVRTSINDVMLWRITL